MTTRLTLLLTTALLTGCNQLPTAAPTNIPAEIHYAPAENLEHLDIDLIGQARKTIDIDAYALTDLAVADALVSAASRGVKIRLYRDNTQTDGELARANKVKKSRSRNASDQEDMDDADDANSAILRLAKTPNVQVLVKHSRTLMHLKAYCVDGKFVRTGSANFSPTGEKRQDNDLIVLRDPASIQRFQQNFNTLWSRPDNESLPQ
ncbi:phospholipase D-like domain-containing protein [Terriglobus tenax]|uniref:phospholipase D-like domain-containing protein n=1 Tax=Terriglobus tenax TaxID=1111115 RepID=UPI0021DF9DF1|nr:phospholipase D-like domain-containing protein [Terriglobus tenax]